MPHAIVLLDIDDTLIDFKKSQRSIEWIGGDAEPWRKYLTALKTEGAKKEIEFHFGLATFKTGPDSLSAAILEQKEFKESNRGLKDLLDEQLIFFTGKDLADKPLAVAAKSSKVEKAIKPAKERMDAVHGTSVDPKNIWIIDDDLSVYEDARKNHYNAAYAGGLKELCLTNQLAEIHVLFEPIFKHFGLEYALPKAPTRIVSTAWQGKFFQPAKLDLDLTGVQGLDNDVTDQVTATPLSPR